MLGASGPHLTPFAARHALPGSQRLAAGHVTAFSLLALVPTTGIISDGSAAAKSAPAAAAAAIPSLAGLGYPAGERASRSRDFNRFPAASASRNDG